MRIEHIAIWTGDLERLKDFYVKYFKADSNELYENITKGFQSYFLSFKEGTRLEIMTKVDINKNESTDQHLGYTHLAVSVGTKLDVIKLTETLAQDGYKVVGEPRETGDGYFESVVLDPDGNRIEITQ